MDPFGSFHQLSICYENERDLEVAKFMYTSMGYGNWVKDTATMSCVLADGTETAYGALMYFNYEFMGGLELEIMCNYGFRLTGRGPSVPGGHYLSHMSVHVDDVDEQVQRIGKAMNMNPAIRFTTGDHTNPAIAGKKHFKEAVFATYPMYGFDIKLIERVMENG